VFELPSDVGSFHLELVYLAQQEAALDRTNPRNSADLIRSVIQ